MSFFTIKDSAASDIPPSLCTNDIADRCDVIVAGVYPTISMWVMYYMTDFGLAIQLVLSSFCSSLKLMNSCHTLWYACYDFSANVELSKYCKWDHICLVECRLELLLAVSLLFVRCPGTDAPDYERENIKMIFSVSVFCMDIMRCILDLSMLNTRACTITMTLGSFDVCSFTTLHNSLLPALNLIH